MNRDDYEGLRSEYARIAPRYDKRWQRYIDDSVRETLKRLVISPEAHVLDVGCGTGTLMSAIASKEPSVTMTGIDLSKRMLEVARRKLEKEVDLREGLAEELPFESGTFDVVVSSSVHHFIRRPQAALSEMRRVLKPGGGFVLTDWCRDFLSVRLSDAYLRAFDRGHFRAYGSPAFRERLEEADFTSVVIEKYRIRPFWGMMTATGSKPKRPGAES